MYRLSLKIGPGVTFKSLGLSGKAHISSAFRGNETYNMTLEDSQDLMVSSCSDSLLDLPTHNV